jgi:glycosyltransferase involved in cell wall biosynthesis
LMQEVPDASLFVIPLSCTIPGRSAEFASRRDILFIGSYRHLPNVDAVHFFVSDIWPLIRQRLPDAAFLILGSDPPPDILALKGDGIDVSGYVEDLAPYFNRCRLSVAPLRFGAGIKGKIVTSLSFGVPCVATQIAAEGMGLTNGRETLIAESPQAFADAVVRLYADESAWQSLSDNGLEFVERNFSLAAGRERLRSVLTRLNVLS